MRGRRRRFEDTLGYSPVAGGLRGRRRPRACPTNGQTPAETGQIQQKRVNSSRKRVNSSRNGRIAEESAETARVGSGQAPCRPRRLNAANQLEIRSCHSRLFLARVAKTRYAHKNVVDVG